MLIIGFDEGNAKTFNIPFIVVSPYTPVGYTTNVRLDHYSTLRGVQEMLGLPFLGNAATSTTSIRNFFGLGSRPDPERVGCGGSAITR